MVCVQESYLCGNTFPVHFLEMPVCHNINMQHQICTYSGHQVTLAATTYMMVFGIVFCDVAIITRPVRDDRQNNFFLFFLYYLYPFFLSYCFPISLICTVYCHFSLPSTLSLMVKWLPRPLFFYSFIFFLLYSFPSLFICSSYSHFSYILVKADNFFLFSYTGTLGLSWAQKELAVIGAVARPLLLLFFFPLASRFIKTLFMPVQYVNCVYYM